MEVDKDQYYKNVAKAYTKGAILKRCRAAIHVEDRNDIPFWSFVLGFYMPNYSFDFISYTRTPEGEEGTGCAMCLKYKDLGCLSDKFLIAIDSDYRYLLQEPEIDAAHFVLQTYTYSIENHYSYPDTVNKAFELKQKFENNLFDFDRFLKEFSEIIYLVYIYFLYSLKNEDELITRDDFLSVWDTHSPKTVDIETNGTNYLDCLRQEVVKKKIEIEAKYPTVNIISAQSEFQLLGLLPENTYLYIRGHNLFEKLISPILQQIYGKLVHDYVKTFSSQEKSEYFGRKLNTNHEYFSQSLHFDYSEIEKIGEDIRFIF
jgi:hypothetical protein